jgi:SAM-dependent methyltransferase
MLTGPGIRLVAVEPVAAMRARLSDAVPGAIVMDGSAEAMPLATGSADAVTVAQAFHWFRTADALAEIHRVLRSGGGLGLMWNRRDLDQPLQAELQRIVRRHRTDEPTFGSGRWRSELEASPLFAIAEEAEFDFAQELDADGLVDRVMSTSVMAVLADAERGAVEEEIRSLADAQPRPIRLRYVTEVYVCERV